MLKPYWFFIILFILCAPSSFVQAKEHLPYAPWDGESNEASLLLPSEKQADAKAIQTTKTRPSALEEIYAQRLIDEPAQFGYDIFTQRQESNAAFAPMGAVQDDFILGSGDTLHITFTGQRTDRDAYIIDPSGMLVIKELPPIPAMGRTISQLRTDIKVLLSTQHNTQAYISLASVRQINVLIVGHVQKPGRQTLNVFHSILDALTLAGGVQKEGSLRQIKLVRRGRSTIIDLYALLMEDAPAQDLRLRDGDRIIIPPIGSTVAIAGAVKRPGIYEIKKSERLTLSAMLDFAGGILAPGHNRFIKQALNANGEDYITEIKAASTQTFGDGAILSVVKSTDKKTGSITLSGHTRSPGLYDLAQHKTLSALLRNDIILGQDIYPLIGVIKRWNKEQLSSAFISFPLRLVLKSTFDLTLQDGDNILLLSNDDISNLDTEHITHKDKDLPDDDPLENPALKSFLKERAVFVRGAVRMPGSYPIASGITLDNIIAVAGGLTLKANPHSIEITSKNLNKNGTQRTTIDTTKTDPHDIMISAGDAVRVNQKSQSMHEKTVLIIGEILHPGTYDLRAGDTLSELLARAGGLTAQSYPAGALFSRKSERHREERRFRTAAQNMKRRLAAAIEREDNPPNAAQIDMVRALADELTTIEAVGRITVEANPAILSARPELDVLLEKGDRIYIPKRPLTVRVAGDILSPASLQFRTDKKPLDYIREAGGFTYHADKNRTFVLYPDGSAQPLKVNIWNHNPVFIPPGSTIIVPRDPKPFDFIESAKEVGQILSNLAITAVFIDDIRD